MVRHALAPLVAGLLGLLGALGATFQLYGAADAALVRVLEERLRGAGEAAAAMLSSGPPSPMALQGVMRASRLEGAVLVSRDLTVLADAAGSAGGRADLLRLDAARVSLAFEGRASVDFGFAVGEQAITTGYFPVAGHDGWATAVLALEAGQAYAEPRQGLRRSLYVALSLSALAALALGAVARQWSRAEAARRAAAERAARGEALERMAAMVAHEVRNPLGIIRGAAELVGARAGERLGEADREALRDVLEEVGRINRLTQDFLDLTREPRLEQATVRLGELIGEAARGIARAWPAVAIRLEVPDLPVSADPGRLRQVLANLLVNACQAGARQVEIRGSAEGREARLEIRDDGPGVAADLQERLFDPFTSSRSGGTGLGLAISRRIVERHGGSLALLPGGPGAAFELRVPLEG
jgi:signal transduction histidine kinase